MFGSSTVEVSKEGDHKIHIAKQQRNARKCVVTIADMDDDLDLKRIAKIIGNHFHCGSRVVKKKNWEEIQEKNERDRQAGGFMSLNDMLDWQTTVPKEREMAPHPILHLPGGEVIQVQGDYRDEIVRFFKEAEIVLDPSRLVVHG